jgi:NADPH:quinone reductase-like Zn-dependent oxidoreductase
MKAMVIRRYGGPDVFEPGEIETPTPGRGEVLVQVRGSSVNPVDCAIRSGMLRWIVRMRFPAVLGVDVAGEVISVGAGVTRFTIGDRVFAYAGLGRGGGGYGEFATLPESYLARVPASLNWAEAGTVPGVGISAFEALTVQAPVRSGMRVFINGAAGGVGTYAVQIAKVFGAHVTGTCSGTKAALVRELGADHIIDYTKEDPFAREGAYDVFLNAVRGAPISRGRRTLRRGGVLVTLTGIPPQAVLATIRNLVSSRRTVFMFVQTSGALLEGLSRLIGNGQVRPIVERTCSWNELPEAHRRVETGRVAGKIAILPL